MHADVLETMLDNHPDARLIRCDLVQGLGRHQTQDELRRKLAALLERTSVSPSI
jgi:hypothetical protein